MATANKVELLALAVTGLDPFKKGDRQEFLKRIVDAIGALDEKTWDGLLGDDAKKNPDPVGEGVQSWYNTCVDLNEAKKELIEFPDADAPAEEEEEDEEVKPKKAAKEKATEKKVAEKKKVAPKADAPAKKGAKAAEKPAAEKKVAEKKAAPVKKEAKPRGGAELEIIKLAITKPKLNAEEIGKLVTEKGMKVATSTVKLQVMRTRRVVAVLSEMGKLAA